MNNRYFVSLLLLAWVALSAQAQQFNVATTQQLRVHLKDGGVHTFDVSQVDSIDFLTRNDTTWYGLPTLQIDVPTKFADSYVQQVLYQGQKVAEVCLEYIRSEERQHVVVYPADSTGRADLTQGISVDDGGTVVWDTLANTVTYTTGNAPVEHLFLTAGRLTTEGSADALPTEVSPEMLIDVRGGGKEELRYPIVKIGTQYWMGQNLATEYYQDGTQLPTYSSTQGATWNANTTGAAHIYADNQDYLSMYGRLYNGHAVLSTAGLAPQGWQVPTIEQWTQLRTYTGTSAALYKSDLPLTWVNDGEGNNLTGFDAYAGGYYSSATGDVNEGQDGWFWSQTVLYDVLTRSNSLGTFRLNNAAKNSVVYSDAGHSYQFGHSVRCVRK